MAWTALSCGILYFYFHAKNKGQNWSISPFFWDTQGSWYWGGYFCEENGPAFLNFRGTKYEQWSELSEMARTLIKKMRPPPQKKIKYFF
jgi:hypothetical protein